MSNAHSSQTAHGGEAGGSSVGACERTYGSGASVGSFGGGSKEQGFTLAWVLSRSGDDSWIVDDAVSPGTDSSTVKAMASKAVAVSQVRGREECLAACGLQ